MAEPIIVLEPGERLLWSGLPQRIALTGLEWFRLVFGSVMVAGFAAAAGLPVPDGEFPVVTVVLAVIGLAVVGGPVLWRLRTTRRAVYAVTDQRVVVADRVSGRTRRSEYLSDLEPPFVGLGQDGAGTLTLTRRDASTNLLGVSVPVRGAPAPIELFVPEADGLCALIVQAQTAD
ncbi:hypothetical protein AB0F15_03130 [Amycolatopsis sp. NPDC026612]|uniref:hypothetical protein n=1 Tax=Amycolatopsis sp. NPDC026612 TaxID=3155466 RepID=UPI0033F728B7